LRHNHELILHYIFISFLLIIIFLCGLSYHSVLCPQLLQPTLKETQAKYQSNPEVMNQKIAELYKDNDVNPLAGCIPSIVQIPVFIGLYRAVLDLANNNKLDEAFLWLPSLEGPVYGADPTKGSAWLFDNWVDGIPSLGWADTAKFLILPVVLVLSQFASMELMATPETKDSQPAFLKFLPLMIGWFSLNVPSALCVYWVTNNVVTTATTVLIRNNLKNAAPAVAMASVAEAVATPKSNVFTPSPTIREKPDGFASTSSQGRGSDGVTPITSSSAGAIDAEVVEDDSVEAYDSAQASESSEASTKKVRL
jgi:YidC/Oxa1 family membrane protein insertase